MYTRFEVLDRPIEEIEVALRDLSENTHLDLSNSNLHERELDEILLILNSISATHLNLGSNFLGLANPDQLKQIFASIRATHVDLSEIGLFNKKPAAIANAFSSLNATCLNVSGNQLGNMGSEGLVMIISSIKATDLDLSDNQLNYNIGNGLKEAISKTKAIHLNLSKNDLGANLDYKPNCSNLSKALSAIPKSMTSLNLSGNILGNATSSLLALLRAIPKTVRHIDLRDNKLFVNLTIAERDSLSEELRRFSQSRGQSLDISNNGDADISRNLLPLLTLSVARNIPTDTIGEIASFLLPEGTSKDTINHLITTTEKLHPGLHVNTSKVNRMSLFAQPLSVDENQESETMNCSIM